MEVIAEVVVGEDEEVEEGDEDADEGEEDEVVDDVVGNGSAASERGSCREETCMGVDVTAAVIVEGDDEDDNDDDEDDNRELEDEPAAVTIGTGLFSRKFEQYLDDEPATGEVSWKL